MKALLLFILVASALSAQQSQAVMIAQKIAAGGGGSILFVAATSVDDGAVAGTSIAASAHKINLSVGDTVYIYAKFTNVCTAATMSFSDDATTPNTYTLDGAQVESGGHFTCSGMFTSNITTAKAAATITMTTTASVNSKSFSVMTFSGLNSSAPIDVHPAIKTDDTSVASITSNAFTTTAANEVIVVGSGVNTFGKTWTIDGTHCNGGAFTRPTNVEPTNTYTSGQYCIVSSTQTNLTAVATVNSATASIGIGVMSLKP